MVSGVYRHKKRPDNGALNSGIALWLMRAAERERLLREPAYGQGLQRQ